ncbi:ribonuclease E inhibitor RraB [Salinimonas iocasae]|uniref:Regulator of ribonuclease activity B n=1 Tax=Salinimonas iocasae TaxID=2572577 RepID=A0A5B7YAZ4_9ALTE|nr:ribonuclease E inhibitor RraB [Salinimonas iocasae]QCZ92660.1 ribonuclease E inhibitor RraB [Salinimonas iocasae]
MKQIDELAEWHAFNQETMDALLEDGSQADADYSIEHHFAGQDFDQLEKAAVDAFKAGFEVSDAEEVYLDDGSTAFCFDAIAERKLSREFLDKDVEALLHIADKHDVVYDGWGTYFMPRGEESDEMSDDGFDE